MKFERSWKLWLEQMVVVAELVLVLSTRAMKRE
jgi:hypothetical protein